MKINTATSALIALGIISLAGAAQASNNPVVYLTGSTAARSFVYSALTTTGDVFDAGTAPKVVSSNNSGSASQIVFEGPINGTTTDIDATWTGSEAGIAAVAGQPLTQVTGNPPATYSLPGVPPAFLTQASGWTTTSTLPIAGSASVPDLSMADTSQAVSLTPKSLYPLNDYGIVAIVPFTIMKGYEATPDTAWNEINNVTTGELNQNLAGILFANFYTGNPADSEANNGDAVVVIGRNKGSGTRANALLNFQYPISQNVDQYGYDFSYPSSAPGVLTFGNNYAAGQALSEIGNDGYDSGSGVADTLCVDGTGSGGVLLGYVGISDGKNAFTHANGGGAAAYLPYNGVYESDSAVENGNYTYWGQEHLLAPTTQTTLGGTVGTKLKAGILAQLTSAGAGTATGALGPVNTPQSVLIPESLMAASRSADGGFPVQAPF